MHLRRRFREKRTISLPPPASLFPSTTHVWPKKRVFSIHDQKPPSLVAKNRGGGSNMVQGCEKGRFFTAPKSVCTYIDFLGNSILFCLFIATTVLWNINSRRPTLRFPKKSLPQTKVREKLCQGHYCDNWHGYFVGFCCKNMRLGEFCVFR